MSLRQLNLSAAILHYCLAISFSVYFSHINKKYGNDPVRGVELSMRDHTVKITDTPDGDKAVWESKETMKVDLKVIQGLLISFFFITGTFHLFYYIGNKETSNPSQPNINNFYSNAIANQNNYFRWIEYSITATMMLYVIAYTSGVKDTNVYLMLFATNITMISLGQSIEVAVRDGKSWWIPMITSFLLLIAEFTVIMRSFWSRLKEVNDYLKTKPLDENDKIPSWLNVMIVILFVFFSCFGFVSLIGAYKHVSYEKIEKIYLILSFVSKASLASFIAYGTGQRQSIKPKK